jgi:hypothetical protein
MKALLKRFLRWEPPVALTGINGIRLPPKHLPEETRKAMMKAFRRAQLRSLRVWLGIVGACGAPVLLGASFFAMAEKHVYTQNQLGRFELMAGFVTVFALGLALTIAFLVVKPAQARIVDKIWREHQICPMCDYDCRSSSERCPECGALVCEVDVKS